MRILQVNKFYYPRGGADKYFLSLSRALESAGHEVAVFAMQHPKNLPSPWSRYFVSRLSFNEGGLKDKLRSPGRVLYSLEAKRKFAALLTEFKPEIIHLHNIYHQLSPSILDVARKRHIPVVFHCHDYKLICPNYQLFVNGAICERCKQHKYYNCLTHRCLNKSLARSLLAAAEAYLHNSVLKTYQKSLTSLIAPSEFMKEKLVAFGWPAEKITVIYNPYDPEFFNGLDAAEQEADYLLYFGRLSAEKGIETLITASQKTQQAVKIAGLGPEEEKLKKLASSLKAPVEFLGFKSGSNLKALLKEAKAVVIPSIWPENMPLSLLESLSLGKIVIASRVGGLPEVIRDKENGFLFTAGDSHDLAAKISSLANADLDAIKRAGRITAQNFSPDKNLCAVLNAYQKAYQKSANS